MYPIVIGSMYISPPSLEYEKMYRWINLRDEQVQFEPVCIWFLAMLVVEYASFLIELSLFCFALG